MISIVNVRKVRTETSLERVMRIELTQPAWKAGILPLNYTRIYLTRILYEKKSQLSIVFLKFFNFSIILKYLCVILIKK